MSKTKLKEKLKTIIIIGTGGTIAGVGDDGKNTSYKSAQIEVKELVSDLPYLNDIAETKSIDLFNFDSRDIKNKNLIDLANYINEYAKKDDIDGFVITHGTDSMEETAYFLNLTVHTAKPIILTGAMRPSTAISPDGPGNLYQAVALAKNKKAVNNGVMIVFADGIYGARDVRKENTFKLNAFGAGEFGCMGFMWDDEACFYSTSTKKHTVNSEFNISGIETLPKVEILSFYPDADSKLLDYCSEISDGIVISGVGCGGVSETWDKKIEKLLEKGFPVVRSSRTMGGRVSYESYEIKKQGIYADSLSPQKSRILLTLALTKTKNLKEIQRFFEEY